MITSKMTRAEVEAILDDDWNFKFLGSVTVYAFMQSVGLVNDHARFCFRYKELKGMM